MLSLNKEKPHSMDDSSRIQSSRSITTISVNAPPGLALPALTWKANANFATEYFLWYDTNTHRNTAFGF